MAFKLKKTVDFTFYHRFGIYEISFFVIRLNNIQARSEGRVGEEFRGQLTFQHSPQNHHAISPAKKQIGSSFVDQLIHFMRPSTPVNVKVSP